MRAASYTQKSLQVSSRIRVQSPSPSRCRGGRLGYRSTAIKLGTEINEHHANEKEEMQALIVRFAGYIVEVQALEQRNTALPAELTALHSRYKGSPTGIGEEYELKFKEVWELIEVLTNEKGAADIERGYLEEEVEVWRLKVEEELALKEEIELLKKLHDEEVAELRKQIEYSKMTAELDGDRPDLAVASRSVQEAEKWYKSKFDTLKEHAGKHEEHMKTMKDEITTFHNKVTELQSQIDALRDMDVKLLEEEEQRLGIAKDNLPPCVRGHRCWLCTNANTPIEQTLINLQYTSVFRIVLKIEVRGASVLIPLSGALVKGNSLYSVNSQSQCQCGDSNTTSYGPMLL
uniref:IF rod domain-containing protein n=1 Tax=Monopterus albus TaxID=43700 RepID=A0A3Q3QHC2_MONAL